MKASLRVCFIGDSHCAVMVTWTDRYLVGDADAGIVPVGADITDGTHDEVVSTVTHFLPTNTQPTSSLLSLIPTVCAGICTQHNVTGLFKTYAGTSVATSQNPKRKITVPTMDAGKSQPV